MFSKPSKSNKFSLSTQEEMLSIPFSKKSLSIGLIKSNSDEEKRVGLSPKDVNRLILNGNNVIVENNAGKSAGFPNEKYTAVGASIGYSKQEVLKSAFLIKTSPITGEEMNFLSQNQVIITPLQPSTREKKYFVNLSKKKVTALCFEMFEDAKGRKPIVRAMSEIAGNSSILIAAEYLRNTKGIEGGSMFGGISGILPSEVVILGAGTVGEFATRAALGFGAQVSIFDFSTRKLDRIQTQVGQRLSTSIIEKENLSNKLKTASVLITSFNKEYGEIPLIITEDMVMNMKKGAVIVDISIDKGSCVETSVLTSHKNPTFKKHGVIHYCVPNIASTVAKTSSVILSRIITPLLLDTSEVGGIVPLISNYENAKNSLYMYKGILTDSGIAETFDLPYKNLNLLILQEKY